MSGMKKICFSIAAVLLVFVISGCATIITGGEQRIDIKTDPASASVKVLDAAGTVVFNSQTPATAILKKGKGFFQGASYRIVIEKKGYKTQEVLLQSNLNVGWYLIGNIFIGGLIGWLIIDPMTGAMWTLSPDNVSTKLAKEASFLQQKEGLMIVLLKDVPLDLLPKLNPVQLPDS